MRVDRKTLIYSVVICLLPILIGVYYYSVLPSEIAIHFGVDGKPNSFMSKDIEIIVLPLFCAILQVVISLSADAKNTPKKGAVLIKSIIPIVSVIGQCALLTYAMNSSFEIREYTVFTIGIIFMVLGNYLPKKEFWGKYNFNLFGLEKGVNEQKVIRSYSKVLVIGGAAIFFSAMINPISSIIAITIFALICIFLPFYLMKKYR
jgi:putative hemolysis inducing protein